MERSGYQNARPTAKNTSDASPPFETDATSRVETVFLRYLIVAPIQPI